MKIPFEITLQLATVDDLFEKPQISPLSADYRPYSYIAGIEYISNELYADPSPDAVHLRLELPADQVTPDLPARVTAAVDRYCQGRLRDVGHELQSLRWRGVRALAVATIALFVFIIASRLIYLEENLVRQVISEGFSIAAWVSFWVPLEMLIFKVWTQRLDVKIYTLLANMKIDLVTAGASSGAAKQ